MEYMLAYKSPHNHYFWCDDDGKLIITNKTDENGENINTPVKNEDGVLYVDVDEIYNLDWKLEEFMVDKGVDFRLPVINEEGEKDSVIISEVELNWLKEYII